VGLHFDVFNKMTGVVSTGFYSRVSNFIMHLAVPKVTEDDAIDVISGFPKLKFSMHLPLILLLHTVFIPIGGEADCDFH
jgi:hypothetical protein